MFAVNCPRHRRPVLLDASAIRAIGPAPGGGLAVHYRCVCGHEGWWPEVPAGERMAG